LVAERVLAAKIEHPFIRTAPFTIVSAPANFAIASRGKISHLK